MTDREHRVEIGPTDLGLGVFAAEDFEAGELIAEIAGQLIDDRDYGSEYCIDLGGDARLEPAPPFRYLNHSCDPNCQLIRWKTRRVGGRRVDRLWLETLQPVKRHAQLTIDYAWPADAAIACRCQSDICRGWIVHPDELGQLT